LLAVATVLTRTDATAGSSCDVHADPVGKLVCASDQLAARDAEINRLVALVKSESPGGYLGENQNRAFDEDQRKWLGQRAGNCAFASGEGGDSPAARCLEDLYDLRIAHLRTRTVSAGPGADDMAGILSPATSVSAPSPSNRTYTDASVVDHHLVLRWWAEAPVLLSLHVRARFSGRCLRAHGARRKVDCVLVARCDCMGCSFCECDGPLG
jgi:uncharacterized protein YecT (DUF1311 family)